MGLAKLSHLAENLVKNVRGQTICGQTILHSFLSDVAFTA